VDCSKADESGVTGEIHTERHILTTERLRTTEVTDENQGKSRSHHVETLQIQFFQWFLLRPYEEDRA
jgi:hypothetical protein